MVTQLFEQIANISSAEELTSFVSYYLRRGYAYVGQLNDSTPPKQIKNIIDKSLSDLFLARQVAEMFQYHPSEDLRLAASEANNTAKESYLNFQANPRFLELVNQLPPDQFTSLYVGMAHSAGANLSEADQEIIRQSSAQIAPLWNQFIQNAANDRNSGRLTVTINSSDINSLGLPEDLLEKFDADESGNLLVTMQDRFLIYDFLSQCQNSHYRRLVTLAARSIAWPTNGELIRQALTARKQLATLYGYPTWADYAASDTIFENADNISKLLKQLKSTLEQLTDQRLKEWNQIYLEKQGSPSEFDFLFLRHQATSNMTPIDTDKFATIEQSMQGLLNFTSQFFNVSFHEIDFEFWHPSISVLEVKDNKSHYTLGHIILDLYHRDAETSAQLFKLKVAPGPHNLPVSYFHHRLSPNQEISLDTIKYLWHDFGHVFQDMLSKSTTFVENQLSRDYFEFGSSLLENLCLHPDVLTSWSPQQLTDAEISQIISAHKAHQIQEWAAIIRLYIYDLEIHRHQDPQNVDLLMELEFILGRIPNGDDYIPGVGVVGLGTFLHQMGNSYASNMYTYITNTALSLVALQDIYAQSIQPNTGGTLKLVYSLAMTQSPLETLSSVLGWQAQNLTVEDLIELLAEALNNWSTL